MELNDVIKGLNDYFKYKFPDNKGWFIGKMIIIPQAIKVYKKCRIELYYHTDKSNDLVVTEEITERATQDQENKLKLKVLIKLISTLLKIRENIDKYGV